MHFLLSRYVGLEEIAHGSEAGIVDEHAQVGSRANRFGHAVAVGVLDQVGGHDLGPNVVQRGDFVGQRAEPVFATSDQHQVEAAGAELSSEFGSNAAGSACDHGKHYAGSSLGSRPCRRCSLAAHSAPARMSMDVRNPRKISVTE